MSIHIHQYSRWKSSDGKRLFIVLGKFFKGMELMHYEVLEPDKEEAKLIPAQVWEQQIENKHIQQLKPGTGC